MNNNNNVRDVHGERRRPGSTGTGERPRAQTPIRRRRSDTTGGVGGGTTEGGGGGTGGMLPSLPSLGGKGKTSCLSIALLVVVFVIYMFINSRQGSQPTSEMYPTEPQSESGLYEEYPTDTLESVYEIPTDTLVILPSSTPRTAKATSKPVSTPKPATAVAGQAGGKTTWTVLLYQDADDKVLEQDIIMDFNEAERVGSSDQVNIVAQVDRYAGGYTGDGNWSGTKRFYLTQDNDLTRIKSKQLADLGEVNMSSVNTLVDFVSWGVKNYPADKYVLILSDHGMGWPGGWTDGDSGNTPVNSRIPLVSRLGNMLYTNQLEQALNQIQSQVGVGQFEVLGMDACLMSHLEVLDMLAPYARYAIVSQETEPSLGWAYTSFLSALKANPEMSGADLGREVVDTYITDDQRIQDDQARREFLRQGSPMGGLFDVQDVQPAQLANQIGQSSTLAAIDLSAISNVMSSLNSLAFNLQSIDQNGIARARSYAQSFTSVFGQEIPPSYLDLGNLVSLIKKQTSNEEVIQSANQVLAAIKKAVVAEKHGPKKPGATGISIFFPNSQIYRNPVAGAASYTAVANRFAANSLWDDFMAFHYAGRSFEADSRSVAAPDSGMITRAPGAGKISLSEIRASGKVVMPGQSINLATTIDGTNVGYVYLFVGFYDSASNSIFVADSDYIASPDTRQVEGVYYPDWGGDGAFNLDFDWEPLMFAITDGNNSVSALLTPESYGASSEEAVYTVDGIYTDQQGGDQRHARLYFMNGNLIHVYGFTGENGTGAPAEITPQTGDTFTILEKWLDLDSSGKVSGTVYQEGGTLTFGDQMFQWELLDAAAGEYLVGFIVEDLDGNTTQVYTQITVK